MDLKKQVCSLELAKKLKELGVEQQSLHYWGTSDEGGKGLGDCENGWVLSIEIEGTKFLQQITNTYAAFTVAELGAMLKEENDYLPYWNGVAWEYRINTVEEEVGKKYESAETEADARAKMLVYLLENGLMK